MTSQQVSPDSLGYAVSEADIRSYFDYPVNIIKYEEIRDFESIDEMLEEGPVFLLIEIIQNFGHWCLIFKGINGSIQYFDSFGSNVDQIFITKNKKLQKVKNEILEIPGQDYMYLTQLLINSPYDIHYNNYKFQSDNPAIATCGKWCIYRLMNGDLTAEKFIYLVLSQNPTVLAKTERDPLKLDKFICKIVK